MKRWQQVASKSSTSLKATKRVVALAFLLALIAPRPLMSLAHAEVIDRVAAVVNNEVITLNEVMARAAPLLEQIAHESTSSERREIEKRDALRRALDDLIGEKLMDGELKSLNIDVTDQEVDLSIDEVKKNNNIPDQAAFEQALSAQGFTMTSYRDFMKKQLAKVKLLQVKVKSKIKISDDDVKTAYAQQSKLDTQDVEIHARHVLIQVPADAKPEVVEASHQKALDVMRQARAGADFAELAKKYSQGPSAAQGGDLGWFRRGTMVAEFENAAFALKKGEVAEPVRTKFGFHVIKVDDVRQGAPKPFDEVKDQLRDKLYRETLEKQTASYINELRRNASVDIKIDELKPDESKSKDGAPPAAPLGPVAPTP
jgi:peptidyl-prolyl cis-trans isomerase SurA